MFTSLQKTLSTTFSPKNYWCFLTMFFLGLINTTHLQAQSVTSYVFSETASGQTYAPITGGTVFATDASYPIAPHNITPSNPVGGFGFNFNYNGTSYDGLTNCFISDNGFITFGTTGPAATTYGPISGSLAYSGAVSGMTYGFGLAPAFHNPAYGTTNNLTIGTFLTTTQPSEIRYETIGTPGNKIFIVQYKNMIRDLNGATSLTGLLNFQIRLYENGNRIEVLYNAPFAGLTATGTTTQQVGLRGTANTDYNNRKGAWGATAAGSNPTGTTPTATADSMLLNTSSAPASVTKFTWTPCYQPRLLSATAVNNSVVTWTQPWVPTSPQNYNYEIRTSGGFGSGASGLVTSGSTGATTFPASGLITGTTYTIYVQSSCGGAPVSTTIVPVCPIATLPYTQDFESAVVPAMPLCNSNSLVATVPIGQLFVTSNIVNPLFTAPYLPTKILTCQAGTNSWYFTQQMNFPTAGVYKISYEYGRAGLLFNSQQMKVYYGLNNTITAGTMTGGILLEDHSNIRDAALFNVINFVVTTPGNYYFGFQCYAPTNTNNILQIDNIVVDVATCLAPTAITAQNITTSTAVITWSPPASIPDGYVYSISTSSTPPANSNINGTGITTATSFSPAGLLGATNYYVWVRTICDGGDQYGPWTPLTVPGAFFTTLTPPPAYCIPTFSTNQNHFTNVTTTDGLQNFSNTSGFSAGGYGNFTSNIVSQAIGGVVNINTTFNSMAGGVGVAVFVDWNGDGDFIDTLPNEKVFTTTAFISVPPTISFTVPSGILPSAVRMRLVVDWFATAPLPCDAVTPTRGEVEDYTFLIVQAPPPLTLNIYTSTQCASTNSPTVTITSNLADFTNYTWSGSPAPTGTFPNYVFNSPISVTYTLTATINTPTFKTNTVKFVYNAIKLPTPIIITPINPIACQTAAVKLTAAGGIVGGIPIFQEPFEDSENEFTYVGPPSSPVNNNTGGSFPLESNWLLGQSPYLTTGGTVVTVSSNDNSQFYIADSDAGGSGVNTDVQLISNPINLQTIGLNPITDGNLTFWHHYQGFTNGTAKVEISINGGVTWLTATPLLTYSTLDQGTRTGFVKAEVNLLPYVGNNNVRIRFIYKAIWGWRWAIDNVEITVSSNSNVAWNTQTAPVANGVAVPGLFTNASAAPGTEYLAGSPAASVWALPNVTTTYTATAKTASPVCPTTTNVTVNYQPIVAGTISAAQTVCSGIANDLTLTGHVGSTIQWQYATNLAFTTPINIGTNSITLTSAEIGAVVSNKYYRAKITNGVCSTFTNIILIGINAVTWNAGAWSNGTGPTISDAAIFQSAFTSTGNLSACSIAINSGAVVTIGTTTTPHVLTVQNAVTTTGGTLIFNNGSSLIQNNNNANTTPITYRRNSTLMNPFDYTYWSSPVAGQTLLGFSPATLTDKFYFWNTNTAVYNWTIVPSVATATMQTGQGYLIRSPLAPGSAPAIFNGPFVGNPNNGNLSRAIEVSGALNAKSLNLIGNPYPSGLSASLFLTANQTIIDGTIFFWSHNTPISGFAYTSNDYASYNLTGGAGTKAADNSGLGNNTIPDGNIASGQAFFAIGKIAGINNVNYTNAMRVTGNSNFYRGNNSGNDYEKNRIWLEMSNNQGAFSQMLYGNIEGATNAKDQLYDGVLFDESPTASLYSVLDNFKLTIKGNGLPFAETDTNQVGFISKISGNYQIKLAMFDGLFESQNIYLEDKFLNTIHDLKISDYNFDTNIGTFEDRFVLRFTNTSLVTNNLELNSNNIIVYKDAVGIHIKSAKDEIKNVTIFDATGRNVLDKTNVNGTELNINGIQVAQQVLLVQVTTIDGKITTRKIIF
jgi:GEVED domain/Fibronectin type III domain